MSEEQISTTFPLQNMSDLSATNASNTSSMDNEWSSSSAGNSPDILLIVSYSLILLLGAFGNSLVIVTLSQNRRMRTVTNIFLLNLAVADLLLGVFCIPVTLIGKVLERFVFGEVMCKAIPYLQATSVSVSVWTLVVISLERYFAICQPLHSRRWQTRSHAYKMIAVVWGISFLCMIPIVIVSKLLPMYKPGAFKCREVWPSLELEITFNIFLDFLLLIIPLFIMMGAYAMITWCLWQGIQIETQGRQQVNEATNYTNECNQQLVSGGRNVKNSSQTFDFRCSSKTTLPSEVTNGSENENENRQIAPNVYRRRFPARAIRSSNIDKSLAAKKHVIRMLFVVVLEFFICWTPLYVTYTLLIFGVRVSGPTMTFIHLLAFVSSCCNPITYCFMNRKFRQAFLQAFGCGPRFIRRGTLSSNGMSFYNRNSTTRTGNHYHSYLRK